ncbi:MAG: YeiH family protein, partial [Phycisphaerae bacterium]
MRVVFGFVFGLVLVGCVLGVVSPGMALGAGILLAVVGGMPVGKGGRVAAKVLLQGAVVLLGFGMDLHAMVRAGLEGAGMAAGTIGVTFLVGWVVTRWLKIERGTGMLISAGTAICGGAAIAAVGSVIGAEEGEMSVAMGTVFLLNAAALYVFPLVGHWVGMTQVQFGEWAGVGIHDVSSVVGAASVFGKGALETATAVKLSRALWIVPVGLVAAWLCGERVRGVAGSSHDFEGEREEKGRGRLQVPWFIGGFVLACVVRTCVPGVSGIVPVTGRVAGAAMGVTLFLIGAGLSRKAI